jgi:preprotein translocase subunit SecG
MTETPAPAAPAVVPGKTLGIVALILAFVFQLLGLILGIVASNQSKKAGVKNGPAKAAIILSIIFMVIGLIIGISLAGISLAAGGAALFGGSADICGTYGTGVWEVNGVTYTCE